LNHAYKVKKNSSFIEPGMMTVIAIAPAAAGSIPVWQNEERGSG
jgi:hypothetical protein